MPAHGGGARFWGAAVASGKLVVVTADGVKTPLLTSHAAALNSE